MASLTISVTGSAVVTGTKTYTLSDADLQAVLDWAKTSFPPAQLPDTRTNGQVMLAWVQSWINGSKDAVKNFRRAAAHAAADAGVTEPSIS